MSRLGNHLSAALVFTLLFANAYAQPAVTPPEPERDWTPVRFSQVMERFAQQQRVNILADYFTREEAGRVSRVRLLRDAPTLENIVDVYQREALRAGSILVLRSKLGFHQQYYDRFHDARAANIFGDRIWQGSQLQLRVRKNEDGTMRVTVRATGIPLKQLCEQFDKETGWKVEVDAELQNTRIFARWQSVSPGEVVEAISLLLQTPVEVKMLLTEEQKVWRRAGEEKQLGEGIRRDQRSDELLPELLAVLTPEEMARFKQGERVEIPLSRLTADIYDRALQYVVFCIDDILANNPENPLSRIRDRLRDTEVVLHLPSILENGLFACTIGISVKDLDGVWNHF